MKSFIFLAMGLLLLAAGVHSCSWERVHPDMLQEPPVNGIVRKPQFPRHKRRGEYPMAQSPAQVLKQAALADLPRLETLRAKSKGNAHYAPPELMDGLASYAKMIELAETGGENAEVAARFFKECAESTVGVTAIRAVCARHYFDLKGTGSPLANMTPTLYRVASKLPSVLRPQ